MVSMIPTDRFISPGIDWDMNSSTVHRDGVISGDYYYVISSYGIYRSPKTSSSYRAYYIWGDGSLNAYANDFVDDYSYG